MKIAVASSGRWLESHVDEHTGRAACFVIYDTASETFETVDNWKCMECIHWAGIQAVNVLSETDVDVLIVRKIGKNSFRQLLNSNIHIFYTQKISVAHAVRLFREGKLEAALEANCEGHGHL